VKRRAEHHGRAPILPSKVYHFAGTKSYGTTKRGAYVCERKLLLEKTALPKQRSTRELARAFSENRRAKASLIAISIPIPIMFDFVAGTRLPPLLINRLSLLII
jgi:hypothetical protein